MKSIIGISTLKPEVMLQFCHCSCHIYGIAFAICYFLLIICIMVRLSLWIFILLCLLCLRTSMLFCSILYDSGSYLVILRMDL